jgi:hypothetical protein
MLSLLRTQGPVCMVLVFKRLCRLKAAVQGTVGDVRKLEPSSLRSSIGAIFKSAERFKRNRPVSDTFQTAVYAVFECA